MTSFPITTSTTLRKAAEIANGINNNVPMLQNPTSGLVTPINSGITTIDNQLTYLLGTTTVPAEIATLTNIQTEVSGLSSSISSFSTHTDRLVFGDSSGALTSSGLSGNLGMATSAINLSDTFNQLSANPVAETCDMIQDFFGSILGAGQALLGQVQSLLNSVLGQVNAGIQNIMNVATSLISSIQNIANQATAMVQNEIAAFSEWIGKQLDFALGSFMASLDSISNCASIVGDVVKTPALSSIID